MCPSLIEIGSKTAEKNSAQTNRQADKQRDRHYENNGHLAMNQKLKISSSIYLLKFSGKQLCLKHSASIVYIEEWTFFLTVNNYKRCYEMTT